VGRASLEAKAVLAVPVARASLGAKAVPVVLVGLVPIWAVLVVPAVWAVLVTLPVPAVLAEMGGLGTLAVPGGAGVLAETVSAFRCRAALIFQSQPSNWGTVSFSSIRSILKILATDGPPL